MYRSNRIEKPIRTGILLVPFTLSAFAGCVDGPLFELKKLNPVIQSQWKADRERGPVFSQRVDEMRLLKTQLPRMTSDEQSKWVSDLTTIVEKETSQEIRREAVLALEEVLDRPEATTTVLKLARDRNDKVRLAAARALKKATTPESTQTLLAMAANDANQSVQMAAIESLGTHRSDDVKQFLAKQLNDRRPLTQYSASLALKDFTGQDFKGDVGKWKRYLAGEQVEPDRPSLAESIQGYVPFLR